MSSRPSERIFIVGCPRSGTTLLQTILAAHSEVASFPESHFFNFYATEGWADWLGRLRHRELRDEMALYFDQVGSEEWRRTFQKWHLRRGRYAELFVEALDDLAERRGASRWVEKTPSHLERIEIVERFVDDPAFLHVVRRGSDVVASLHEVTNENPEVWGGAKTVDECIDRWFRSIRITRRYADEPNHRVVPYADLTESPEATVRGVCDHLGLPFESEMLEDYSEQADDVTKDREDWKEKNKGPIEPRRGSRFERHFEEHERAYILERLEERDAASLLDSIT